LFAASTIEMSELQVFLARVETEFRVTGQLSLDSCPPAWIVIPREGLAARGLTIMHVETLMKSFASRSTVNVNVVLLFEFDPNNAADMEVVSAWRADKKAFKLQDHPYLKLKLQAIVGAHTITGIQRLHKNHPQNKRFNHVKHILYFMEKGDDCQRWADVIGIRDNQNNEVTLKMTVWDHIQKIRLKRHLFIDAGIASAVKHRVKSDMMFASGLSSGAFGQLKTLAVMRDDLFKEIGRLFTNNPPLHQRFQSPTAMTHFTRVGGIPADDLLLLLQNIATDKLTMKDFMDSCATLKARSRIMTMFLEAFECKTMMEFTAEAHVTEDHVVSISKVINSYAGQIKGLLKKDPLPDQLITDVGKIKQEVDDAKAGVARAVDKVHCCSLSVFCCVCQ
jgi:hypothetical protein